jgi:hypothetical protein
MFKPGDLAVIVASGEHTTVKAFSFRTLGDLPTLRAAHLKGGLCPIETTNGVFDEGELRQAHPTVLDNAAATPVDLLADYIKDTAGRPPIDYKLRSKVVGAFRSAKLEVDLRGHWKNGSVLYDPDDFKKRILDVHLLGRDLIEEDLNILQGALHTGTTLDRWVDLGLSVATLSTECSYCGEKRFRLETNGKKVRLSGKDCPLPNGFELNEWELNVPSGKIIVANDLRRWFPLPEGDDEIESINTVIGCRQTSQAYAAIGMSHAMVGNTSPAVFKLADGKFKIANEPQDEYWNGKEYVPYKRKPKFEGVRLAGICTDLWWYSLCDSDEFDRRAEKFGGSLKEVGGGLAEIISVKPGVYRFRHNDDARDDDTSGKEVLFATFEWVRKPDPVRDFLKSWKAVEVNAHAYVQAKVKQWPTLYGAIRDRETEDTTPWAEMTEEQRLTSWQRVADATLCVIGGGVDWHEKGFPLSKVDPTAEDIEPPSFRYQCHWYPFSKEYGGLFEPKTLAPSFAKLAFRVLESVISFGMDVRDGSHSREVWHVRERMLLAVKRYRELAKKYPDLADPDYVWWLQQKGRAEAWVERFDLGPTFTEKHRTHAASQRWVPEDAYAVEFDSRKLKDGHFAWARGQWASKEDAEKYAIDAWEDNGQPPEHNCFWSCNAKTTAIPLYSVARVIKLGEVSHMGDTLVEVAFDYGTPWMTNPAKRKGLKEREERAAIRVLTKTEYEALLPKAKKFFKAPLSVSKIKAKKKST